MSLLEIIIIILLVLWIGGLLLDVAGDLIHFLLLAALVLIVLRLLRLF